MRLLVITHTFPPSRYANAKRPYYLVKGLLEAGHSVDVFTLRAGLDARLSETVIHPALRILRREDPVVNLLERCARHPRLYRVLGLAIGGTLWPDPAAIWSLRTLAAGRRAGGYDRVVAFVYPASLLLSGLWPALVGPHWLFDFQESVTPQLRRHARRSLVHRMLLPALARLERRVLHKAGRVVFTADTNRQEYIRAGLVPEPKTAHIPYFYDADVFRGPAREVEPDFQIAYFGTFDWAGARSPETFLRALAAFLEKRPEARPRTRFLFHGSWLAEHHRFIEQLGLRDVTSIQPAIGYEPYLEKVKASPVLLLVVASIHNLFMPSKIVDYFGAQRPIMAFVPRHSEMRQVLEQAGMTEFVRDEFDVAGGAQALETLWDRHQSGRLEVAGERTQFWSSEFQIPRYLKLLTGMEGAGPPA